MIDTTEIQDHNKIGNETSTQNKQDNRHSATTRQAQQQIDYIISTKVATQNKQNTAQHKTQI